jgi:hypothetical protein
MHPGWRQSYNQIPIKFVLQGRSSIGGLLREASQLLEIKTFSSLLGSSVAPQKLPFWTTVTNPTLALPKKLGSFSRNKPHTPNSFLREPSHIPFLTAKVGIGDPLFRSHKTLVLPLRVSSKQLQTSVILLNQPPTSVIP